MARAPAAAAAPISADDAPLPDAEMAPAADVDVEAEPIVVVTILKNADGSYLVVEGDEPDAPAAEGEGMPGLGAEAPAGKTVDSVGAALKAAMDILQGDAETEDGMSGQQLFEAGFKGGDTASPPKPKAPPVAA